MATATDTVGDVVSSAESVLFDAYTQVRENTDPQVRPLVDNLMCAHLALLSNLDEVAALIEKTTPRVDDAS